MIKFNLVREAERIAEKYFITVQTGAVRSKDFEGGDFSLRKNSCVVAFKTSDSTVS